MTMQTLFTTITDQYMPLARECDRMRFVYNLRVYFFNFTTAALVVAAVGPVFNLISIAFGLWAGGVLLMVRWDLHLSFMDDECSTNIGAMDRFAWIVGRFFGILSATEQTAENIKEKYLYQESSHPEWGTPDREGLLRIKRALPLDPNPPLSISKQPEKGVAGSGNGPASRTDHKKADV